MDDLLLALKKRAQNWHGMELSAERIAMLGRLMDAHVVTDWLVLARRGPQAPNLCMWALLDEAYLLHAAFTLTGRPEGVAFSVDKVSVRAIDVTDLQAGPTHLRCSLHLPTHRTGQSRELVITSEFAYDPAEATLAVQAFVEHVDRLVFPRRR